MTRLEALATFDILGTSTLLVWGVSTITNRIKRRITDKQEMLQQQELRRQQAEEQRISTINKNRTTLWSDYEREVI